MRAFRSTMFFGGIWLCGLVGVLGLAIRLTVRDRIHGPSILFYATPWLVLAVLFMPCAILSFRRRWQVTAVVSVLLVAGCLVGWHAQSFARNEAVAGPIGFRVFSWNAEHSKSALPKVIEFARTAAADILGVTETESTKAADESRWKAAFPGHTVRNLPGAMLFITVGDVVHHEHGSLAGAGRYNVVGLRLKGRAVTVLFVEFDAWPFRSREPAFRRLNDILREHAGETMVLMGDFNTPRDSVLFAEIRARMRHAFEVAGNGFADTWPVPLP